MDGIRRTGGPLHDDGPAAPSAHGEFAMTADDLRRISQRGQALLGLELGQAKRQMVYSRLSRRLRALGMTSFSAYLDHLETPAGLAEIEPFTNALTTNMTAFFREAHHFAHFEREIQRTPADHTRRFRVWSAGCSTGEEAYSIAMILHANAERLTGRDRRILGSDVDTEVLDIARRGTYAAERLASVPPRFRAPPYLRPGSGEQTIGEPVRNLVVFRALNLIGPWPFRGAFDVVFCRNVLIYFAPEIRDRIVDRIADLLQPGGVLYLGHSESILGSHPKLVAEGHTIYRRCAE
jgi:chemotaxis protein methyltransferase CheR